MNNHLALFDIDKTIYNGFTIFSMTDFQLKQGLISKNFVDELYDDLDLYKKGSAGYEETVANLCIHWANGLKGTLYSQILKNTEDFFKSDDKFYAFFPKAISHFVKTHDIYLITGGPQFIAKTIADKFGVTGYVAAEFEVIDDCITGNIKSLLAKRTEKQAAIQYLLAKYERIGSFAFGDSEGDIEMLEAVQHPVCVNASSGLQKVALEKGWNIKKPEEVEDLVVTVLKSSIDQMG